MTLRPWSDVLFVAFAVAILLFMMWMVIKRDRSADPGSEPMVPKNYEKLPMINKIRVLMNKLIDVRRRCLGQNKSEMTVTGDRVAEVQRIQSIGELQYQEVLLQCMSAIEWLEMPEEFRRRCAPPEISEPYKPLTAADVKRARELVSMPADGHRRERPPVSKWASARNAQLSLPRVDRWIGEAVLGTIRDLDLALDVMDGLWDAADVPGRARGAVDLLRRGVAVNVKMDLDGDRTTIVLDFMLPDGTPLDRLPNAVATGPVSRPLRGLCCIPVRYTKPDKQKK